MNKISDDQFKLDGSEASWEINYQSPLGQTYLGLFKFKTLLSPIEQVRIDRDYRELIGGTNPTLVSNTVDNIAFCAANLKHRIISSPPFWDDGNTNFPGTQLKGEAELLALVMEAALKAEDMYRAKLKERHEKAIEGVKQHLEKLKKEAQIEKELAEIDKDAEQKEGEK